ncbi:anaphase-promoting complex subunit 5-domain-containing protein [Massariosphaeria phaeospora]|uniref:Anaphase-promoting complex subunit 5 n=1 Tax=Massariosphaeria phaeospora TaxID=100035 RepID=A0A7C8M3E0_9PLEO|nr:anaphase-promoting complex subunit 5-domain-containing protein [Massariosphaeria phaeospora]
MATPRYLTAHKISLLILVKIYCGSPLPASATIPVLSFIISHSIPSVSSTARARPCLENGETSFSVGAFEDALQGIASSMPGRTLLDLFLKHMWELSSFDTLHDLFDGMGHLVRERDDAAAEPLADRMYLSRTSPVGAFVRRARLEFIRLQFDDAMKLWSAFIRYRAPTAQWTKRLAGYALDGVDKIAGEMGLGPGDDLYEVAYGHLAVEEREGTISIDDFDRLLEFQLDQLQRLGSRVPDEMREQLRTMLGPSGVALRQSHLVKFFDAWKAGDYTSAFDNLHRYYDYAMQTREKIHYQYALLHMAILQADFGCFGEAIAAINETIATARENQDMTCLNFSLSWLNHMSKAYPRQMKGAGYMGMLGSERDGLTFLKAKAKETRMYNLLSATLLNEAKLCLASGESIPRALEYMYQASHLHIKESINNHGSQMLLLGSLFSRLGITHLSDVHCQLLLHCYEHSCPIDERIRSVCRCALSAAQYGRYDEALDLLQAIHATTHRSLKYHQYLFLCTGLVKLKRAVRRTDWTACESLLSFLKPDSSTDPEMCFMLSEARVEYLMARGLHSDAFSAIEALSTSLREEGVDILHRITILLAKAELFRRVGKPTMGFSVTLRAASVAFKARLMPCLWSATGLLASILSELGEYDAAARLLHAAIPQALEHNDNSLVGVLYSHIGDSYMGLAGLADTSAANGARLRAANVSRAELYINRAQESFKKVEDITGECEQLMKKAVIARLRGDEKLAEEWAQNHNRVWEAGLARLVDSETSG